MDLAVIYMSSTKNEPELAYSSFLWYQIFDQYYHLSKDRIHHGTLLFRTLESLQLIHYQFTQHHESGKSVAYFTFDRFASISGFHPPPKKVYERPN